MNIELLKNLCKTNLNLILDDDKLFRFDAFSKLVIMWNEKFNLTSITDEDEMLEKHFYDCLCIHLVEDFNHKSVVDVGSGAGFPGLVLAIAFPSSSFTLIESNGKKVTFLKAVVDELHLKNVAVLKSRAEDFVAGREKFDIAVARAVSQLNILLELIVPLLKTNGRFIAYKGPRSDEEIANSKRALSLLNASIERVNEYSLPLLKDKRCLVSIKKTKETKRKYPRDYASIVKSPL